MEESFSIPPPLAHHCHCESHPSVLNTSVCWVPCEPEVPEGAAGTAHWTAGSVWLCWQVEGQVTEPPLDVSKGESLLGDQSEFRKALWPLFDVLLFFGGRVKTL